MKNVIQILIFCVMPSLVFSQEWKDSLNVARKLYNQGKYKEALKYYKSAEKLKPNDVDLSQEKAQAEYRANEFGNAAKNYEEAASSAKTTKQKSSVLTNSGTAKMKEKDYAGAEENFKEALRQNPNNEKARQQLVEARKARKKQEEEQKKNQDKNCKNPPDKNEDNQQNQQQNKNQNQNQQQNKQQGQNKQQQNGQGDKKQSDQKNQEGKGKLGDKQTERKLDELSRQEMGTKRRIEGSKGNGSGSAKKNW